ncbi:FecCD family ABC transporter permease [Actinomadura algeriensis]|uniref:Iron complex transport system permease protein n=1 Tax=Actinomadura algeriensis TaxID=1679523 RepID=A0ABR9JQ17_9ACTN|nr:iron chelate uptake ABC transporter family permease subunit [Actinomadura algeriensis]MBE1532647.1 iron complex transport system permease protein [Actinomadura algeriensis]
MTTQTLADVIAANTRVRRTGRAREIAVGATLAALVVAALCAALAYGDMTIPPADIAAALTGGGDGGTHFIVVELRLPRALTALLVGLALGMAGAVFQTLLRNPLASPDVIGISAGSSAGAVIASLWFGLGGQALSAAALAGALLAAGGIYALAWRRGVSGHRLVLIGIGAAAGLMSLVSYAMTRAEVTEAQEALQWLTGSLNGRTWTHVWPLLIGAVVLVPATLAAARALPALQLGDDTAKGLGARVERGRLALFGCAVGLVAIATAAAGPVDFVALLAAPIARRLLPGRGAALVPSALTGAVIVLAADFAAQHAVAVQFPVGVVTALIGAPFLLWLLTRVNRQAG